MKWKRKPDPLERVLRRVERTSDACWTFTGALRNGYGVIGVDLKTVYIHRYVYERLVGPIPDGLVIDHLCRNRACCNPDHLEVVTQRTNLIRGVQARGLVTSCKRGHEYTPENTYTNPQGYRACRTCKRKKAAA